MKLYHASTVKIDNFYIPYGGLHMGGKHSALEAALRKLRSPLNVVDACTVYLHTLEVDVDNVLLSEDLGSDDEWRSLIENCTAQGYDAVQYKNDYEPDNVPSFMIWDTSKIRIIEVDAMHMDEAEMIIEDFLDEYEGV
ncbi:hypothetical protein HI213_RS24255 [Escherichia coli]|nr:hypothetical protein [Escherichia coli]